MIINIEVKNRVATYRSVGSDPVCGSNNDVVKFHFDEEWKDVTKKTARFIWGGRYYDQEFEGDCCPVPVFVNLTRVYIGVYAGEPVENEPAWATTKTEIPYQLSVRCGYEPPHEENEKNYAEEAKGYALEAKAAAEIAIEAADRSESAVREVQQELESAVREVQEDLDSVAQEVQEGFASLEEQIGQLSGLTEAGSLKLRMSLSEVMDEEGNYSFTFTFGEGKVDPVNGTVLLECQGGGMPNHIRHSLATTVLSLMRCTFTRFVFEHSDPNNAVIYPTILNMLSGGEVWKQADISYDGSECRLSDTEWTCGGPRLVVYENPLQGSRGSEPVAIFLQFPKELKMLIDELYLDPYNDSSFMRCTIIGYQ